MLCLSRRVLLTIGFVTCPFSMQSKDNYILQLLKITAPTRVTHPSHLQRRFERVVLSLRFELFPVRSPLLGESRSFSFLLVTEMFHFASLSRCSYEFTTTSSNKLKGVSPFGNPRVQRLLSASRGLSQTITSFIDFLCQGIHHMHLVALSLFFKH